MTMYPVVTRTVEQRGIELPWQRVERYGPYTTAEGKTVDKPPKGTVLEEGTVFIPLSTLEELSEQDVWDSQFGSAFLLDYHEGLALKAVGLAAEETRGGFHRTEKLLEFLKEVYAS